MERLLAQGLSDLLSLIEKYRHGSFSLFFKQRKCFYLYIPLGLQDFLSNTELRDQITLVLVEEVLNALLPENELKTFNDCLENAYNAERKTPEPFRSICKQTLKSVIDHYVSINSNGKKILFITSNYKLHDLITSKKKFVMIPSVDVIDRDIGEVGAQKQIDTLKIIIKMGGGNKIYSSKLFNSISELDTTILSLLKIKKKKI